MTPAPSRPKISVIVPVLNESEGLRRCLRSLTVNDPPPTEIEIIISDGGSADDTVKIAREFPVKIIHTAMGRACQMNAGADAASGDTLLFLHADTTLPGFGYDAVIESLEGGFSMGCFERRFTGTSKILQATSACAGWRARKTFWVYGDQAMFIRRDLFERIGGFKPLPRFEDLELAIRAKAHGKWSVLPHPVTSDARRFKGGMIRRIASDFLLTLGWLTGVVRK